MGAVTQFEKAARIAWEEEKYFIYIISCLNIQRLITPKEDEQKLEESITNFKKDLERKSKDCSSEIDLREEGTNSEIDFQKIKLQIENITRNLEQVNRNNERLDELLRLAGVKSLHKVAYSLDLNDVEKELVTYILT